MNNELTEIQELEVLERREKISIRAYLNECGMGDAGMSIDLKFIGQGLDASRTITISGLAVEIKRRAIKDKINWVKSNGGNDSAKYPRKWLSDSITQIVTQKSKEVLKAFVDQLEN